MATYFEIYIKSIQVIENGRAEDHNDRSSNIVTISLLKPRPGVQNITSIYQAKLEDGQTLDLSQEDIRKTFLFGEDIRGNCIIDVEVSAKEKVSKLSKILHKIFGTAASAALGAITGPGVLISGILSTATDSLFDSTEPKDKIHSIGKGYFPINEDLPSQQLPINLAVPEDIEIYRDNGARYVLKKEKINVKVEFEIRRFD